MLQAGFEPAIPASEGQPTCALRYGYIGGRKDTTAWTDFRQGSKNQPIYFLTAVVTVNPIGRLVVESWIGFRAAATTSNKMAGFYFLVWSLSRLSCRFWLQCSRNLRPCGHRDRQLSPITMLIQDKPTNI